MQLVEQRTQLILALCEEEEATGSMRHNVLT